MHHTKSLVCFSAQLIPAKLKSFNCQKTTTKFTIMDQSSISFHVVILPHRFKDKPVLSRVREDYLQAIEIR